MDPDMEKEEDTDQLLRSIVYAVFGCQIPSHSLPSRRGLLSKLEIVVVTVTVLCLCRLVHEVQIVEA